MNINRLPNFIDQLVRDRRLSIDDGNDGQGGGGGDKDPAPAADDEVNDELQPYSDDGGEFDDSGERQPPATADGELPADDGGEEGGKKKEPHPTEERIGELTGKLRETERVAAEKDRDILYWKGRAEGTINEDGTPVNPSQPESTASTEDLGQPNPDNYQYGDTDAAYIKDLARYESDKRFDERMAEQDVATQLKEVEIAHAERVSKAKEVYPDYDEVVVAGATPDPVTGRAKWSCSQVMALGIKTSEYGPDIAHQLASNPEESDRIALLSPLEQAKEFGRMEYRAELAAKARQGNGSDATHRVSNAPEPPPRARGAGGKSDVDWGTDNFSSFEQKADAHLKTKRRR